MSTTTVTNDPKIESIQNFYAAYGRRDLDAALADLADDVDWAAEACGDSVPWYGTYRGKAEVPNFFAAIGSSVEISEFDIVTITANDDNVIAVVHWAYTVIATGKTASMYMQHWFRFDAGKIVFFRGSEDSGQSARAFAVSGTA